MTRALEVAVRAFVESHRGYGPADFPGASEPGGDRGCRGDRFAATRAFSWSNRSSTTEFIAAPVARMAHRFRLGRRAGRGADVSASRVLILSENTERPEAVECGIARLVGSRPERLRSLLEQAYRRIPGCAGLEESRTRSATARRAGGSSVLSRIFSVRSPRRGPEV